MTLGLGGRSREVTLADQSRVNHETDTTQEINKLVFPEAVERPYYESQKIIPSHLLNSFAGKLNRFSRAKITENSINQRYDPDKSL